MACTANEDSTDSAEQNWDSQDGNPTHATHSLMAEYAVKNLKGTYPEVKEFEKDLVRGANMELHELHHKTHEELRLEVQGTNWGADRPSVLWDKAKASYAAGDKPSAYFYVGIMLHYVQDMGVPAHAFHVIHQSKIGHRDNIEILGFFDFHADFDTPAAPDPAYANPVDYIEWSAETARQHFTSTFPGATYSRHYFPQAYDNMTETHWAFLRRREADCARGTQYALASALRALTKS